MSSRGILPTSFYGVAYTDALRTVSIVHHKALQRFRSTHTNTLVTDTQDRLGVGTNKEVDVPSSRLLKEVLFHGILVRKCEVQPFTPTEQMRIAGDRVGLTSQSE